jgi:hypothetical protein
MSLGNLLAAARCSMDSRAASQPSLPGCLVFICGRTAVDGPGCLLRYSVIAELQSMLLSWELAGLLGVGGGG